MRMMAVELQQQRAATNVEERARNKPQTRTKTNPDTESMAAPRSRTTPGRNDPCGCGSGRKFKKCCLPKRSTNTTQSSRS
jgi:uncharacterized protein YecA (UPF0149 family)